VYTVLTHSSKVGRPKSPASIFGKSAAIPILARACVEMASPLSRAGLARGADGLSRFQDRRA
jgi:hypothetical protein